jgi:Peptidase_C39 like family
MSRRPRKRILVLATVVLAFSLCLLALPGLATATTPDAYLIDGVPFYQQIQAMGCGAAATQMVLDYWGPFVNQKAIYDSARTFHGSSLPDLARAGQFSLLSYSAGDRFPSADGWGYDSRPLGYGGFYYAQQAPWLERLKAVVAQGYPVICLTDWLPGVYGPHYRVVVGYDDAKGVIILNDPWGRELKGDFDYQGSGNQNAAYDRQGEFVGWKWTYADFLSVWKLPSDGWGVPGANYGAVLIAPWQVQIDAPAVVAAGASFTAHVTVTYPCAAPFATDGFPTFPAAESQVRLDLPAGFSGGAVSLGTMTAGETKTVAVTIVAGAAAGTFDIGATASGLVSGSLGIWRSFPAYEYQDVIGGSASDRVTVTD